MDNQSRRRGGTCTSTSRKRARRGRGRRRCLRARCRCCRSYRCSCCRPGQCRGTGSCARRPSPARRWMRAVAPNAVQTSRFETSRRTPGVRPCSGATPGRRREDAAVRRARHCHAATHRATVAQSWFRPCRYQRAWDVGPQNPQSEGTSRESRRVVWESWRVNVWVWESRLVPVLWTPRPEAVLLSMMRTMEALERSVARIEIASKCEG